MELQGLSKQQLCHVTYAKKRQISWAVTAQLISTSSTSSTIEIKQKIQNF